MVSVNRYDIQHVIFNGNYVSDVQLDLDPNDGHGVGWQYQYSWSAGDAQPGDTIAGNKSIWSTYAVQKFYDNQKPYLTQSFGGQDWDEAPTVITRDGGSYYINLNSLASEYQATILNNSPIRPTYNLTGSNVNLVTNRGIGTNYSFDSWNYHWYNGTNVYDNNIMIYKKPYIGNVSLTMNALTTPNQFYPSNLSHTITLVQPSVWADIGVIDTTSSASEAASYPTVLSPLWDNNGAFYFKVILYKPDWDSISDMSISWSITGGKYDQFSPNSGTITSFRQMVASGWSDYAIGYAPIQMSMGDSLMEENTNFNIVANGLKLDSFTNPKVMRVLG